MEPLSEVKANTSNFILIACDVFTRRLMATPVATQDPEVVIEGLKRIGVRGGVPRVLDVDRGGEWGGVVLTFLAGLNPPVSIIYKDSKDDLAVID